MSDKDNEGHPGWVIDQISGAANSVANAGITPNVVLLRFERGQVAEFGSRKLLAVLAVLGLEMTFKKAGTSGTLDELRIERGGA